MAEQKAKGLPKRHVSNRPRYAAYTINQTRENNKFRKLGKYLRKHPADGTAYAAWKKLFDIVSTKVRKAFPLDTAKVEAAIAARADAQR